MAKFELTAFSRNDQCACHGHVMARVQFGIKLFSNFFLKNCDISKYGVREIENTHLQIYNNGNKISGKQTKFT